MFLTKVSVQLQVGCVGGKPKNLFKVRESCGLQISPQRICVSLWGENKGLKSVGISPNRHPLPHGFGWFFFCSLFVEISFLL